MSHQIRDGDRIPDLKVAMPCIVVGPLAAKTHSWSLLLWQMPLLPLTVVAAVIRTL